jgi:hypothetical protein
MHADPGKVLVQLSVLAIQTLTISVTIINYGEECPYI